jgi:hypothetical protein
MKKRPDSKAGRLRAADKLIRSLLRTPKTRGGLIAAVAGKEISQNFVYGWLSERRRDGTVTVLKGAGQQVMYQISEHVVVEMARPGIFPSWLEPRHLPVADKRCVYIDGQPATNEKKKGKS